MIIQVKRKHIRAGDRKSPSFCPVALALREATADPTIRVEEAYISSEKENGRWPKWAFSPRSVERFVARHDAGKTVKPFNFRFEL